MGFGGNPAIDGLLEWIFDYFILRFWIAFVLVVAVISLLKTRRNANAFWRWLPILIPISYMPIMAGLLLLDRWGPVADLGLITAAVLLVLLSILAIRLNRKV